jgi:phosphoribosylformylglycinamidine synthase
VPADLVDVAKRLTANPNIASKRWITTQYDSMVGVRNTSTNLKSDAALIRITGKDKGLAVTTDCNARYVYANPHIGCMIAVAEAARNIVCSGAEPAAVTNCLNFGNPYNPEVYWQFANAIRGMGDACRKFDTPVTGGNVSFYNQSEEGPVYPTPTIGMVGVLESYAHQMTMDFINSGNVILLVGTATDDMACSEYLKDMHGVQHSPAPRFDLDEEYRLQQTIKELIRKKLIYSAHDVSEGGLFIALIESSFNKNLGFDISTDSNVRKDACLFGEAQSRVVVSANEKQLAGLKTLLASMNIPFEKLGAVTKGSISIDGNNWGSINEWKEKYDNAIGNLLAGHDGEQALSTL